MSDPHPTGTPADARCFLTLAEASRMIAARALSPVEYLAALEARIDALDDQLSAFVTRTPDIARAQAKAAEDAVMRGELRGPLQGIPFALKDIFATAGVRTTGHSRLGMNDVPSRNATTAQRLIDAGAVMLGKLSTHEYASGGPSLDLPWPPARNPWDTACFTGGSSSGSGAAVAAGFCPAALGTDTGGSIRIPAALCGLAGLKPTYGRVSRQGVIPNAFSFDHAGPLAWTVEDCALILQCIAGHDPDDPTSARVDVPDYRGALTGDIRGVRIGVLRHQWEEEGSIHPEAAQAVEDAIRVLEGLGARIATARMPRTREAYNDVKMVIAKSEIVIVHEQAMRERLSQFGADFIGRNLPGFLFTAADYVRAQRERRRMVDEMAPLYREFDVLLTAASAPATRLDALIGSGFSTKWETPNIYTPFSVTGGPTLALCNGFTASGLPLSMQIAGRPWDEATVLRVGDAYERATSWRSWRPRLVPGEKAPELVVPAAQIDPPVSIDDRTRATVDAAIQRAGLALDDRQRNLLYRVARPVLDAVARIRRDHPFGDEPGNAFFLA